MTRSKFFQTKVLREFLTRLFFKAGLSGAHASVVASGLVETSLRGVDSHGVRLAPHYIKAILAKRINPKPKFTFMKTAPGVGLFNADNALGMVAGVEAMERTMKLAEHSGIGAVAVKNSSHFGAAAVFALRAAKEGFLAFAFTHTESLVVPFGGKRPVLGTNPICFAAPCEGEEPICLDMSTSNLTWNKLQMLKAAEDKIPPGWAVDRLGRSTSNHRAAEFLTHIASYKGYGLALVVEVLCSLLSGGKMGPALTPMVPINAQKRNLSHFFLAIDIRAFMPIKKFVHRMKLLVDQLRGQRPAKGFKRVLVAGDPEKSTFQLRSKTGIPVSSEMLVEFKKIAKHLKVLNTDL